ncbi:Nipped-B-like protein A [Holothuria leucospilota]|uniref:Nipped-B-like protein A n=1 Tax=Holothuria leucospilota TaxID=206669 RepID=A0A9Q1H1K8_HOLLE|nr:Nipped-B-like protein A [Holothuria leucospilota]
MKQPHSSPNLCLMIQIGNQGRFFQKKVTLVDDYGSVSKGDLASVHLEDKSGRPFIAKFLEVNADMALIHWMRGSWSGPWQMWTHGVGKRAKPYTSLVPVASLMLWGFSLTNKHRLKKQTVEMLKAKYLELDSSGVVPSL